MPAIQDGAGIKLTSIPGRLISLALLVLFLVGFSPLYSTVGLVAVLLAIVPVIAIAEAFGLWAGLGAGLALIPLHLLYMLAIGHPLSMGLASVDFWYMHLTVAIVGGVVGYTRQLRNQLAAEIQQRRETEDALAAKERTLRSFFDNSPDSIRLLDEEGRIIEWNPASETIVGIDAKHAVGQYYWDLKRSGDDDIPGDERERARRLNTIILETGKVPDELVDVEYQIHRKNGESQDLHATIFPIKTDKGHMIGGIVRDVTRSKKFQRDLETLNAELEDRISERTRELERANEELVALGRVRDEFVSNVSHELRTPIANLKLYLTLLSRHAEKLDVYLATLEREARRLDHLVESLLVISRLDQLSGATNLDDLDINSLVDSLVLDRQALAKQKAIQLELQKSDDLPPIKADVDQVEQVVGVLLTNAVNYTPAGGRVRVCTALRDAHDDRWVGLTVSDTGPGIAPGEREEIFNRFYRGKAARESGAPGTGLGLAIAREIIERHQGRIDVESEGVPGKGATFSVWFPRGRGASASADERQAARKEA